VLKFLFICKELVDKMTQLSFDARMFVIYGGMALFCFNFFGSVMKIIMFSTVGMYRNTPGTFYMLISAIGGSIQLLNASILSRYLGTGFFIDITRLSLGWCKVRQYLYVTCPAIAITCDWLATVDQFLVTSRSARLRNWSKIKFAHRIVIGVLIFWFLAGLPFLVFTEIRSVKTVYMLLHPYNCTEVK
jgi:hypothetical protein